MQAQIMYRRVQHVQRQRKRKIYAECSVSRNRINNILRRTTDYSFLELAIGPDDSLPSKRLLQVWDTLSEERQQDCGGYVQEFCKACFGQRSSQTSDNALKGQGAILRNPDILHRFSLAEFQEVCQIIKDQRKNKQINTAALYAFSGKCKHELEWEDLNVGLLLVYSLNFLQYNYEELRMLLAQLVGRQLHEATLEKIIHLSFNTYGHLNLNVVKRISKNWDILTQNGVTNDQMVELSNEWMDFRLHKADLSNKWQKMKICFLVQLVQLSLYSALKVYPRIFEVSMDRLGQRYMFLKSFGIADQFNKDFLSCVCGEDERFCEHLSLDYAQFLSFLSCEWDFEYKTPFYKELEQQMKCTPIN